MTRRDLSRRRAELRHVREASLYHGARFGGSREIPAHRLSRISLPGFYEPRQLRLRAAASFPPYPRRSIPIATPSSERIVNRAKWNS